MEDPKHELEIPEGKSEKENADYKINPDNSYSVLDALNRTGSDNVIPEYEKEIEERDMCALEKYILAHSKPEVMPEVKLENESVDNQTNLDNSYSVLDTLTRTALEKYILAYSTKRMTVVKPEKEISTDDPTDKDNSYSVIGAVNRNRSDNVSTENVKENEESTISEPEKCILSHSTSEGISVVKPENEISIDDPTDEDNSYSVIGGSNRSGSETSFPKYVKETSSCDIEKCILSDSTPEEHQPEAIDSLDIEMKNLTSENKGDHNNATLDDERVDTNSRSTEFKSSIDEHQAISYKSQKCDPFASSSRKNECDNRTSESIECTSSPVTDKSPNPSISSAQNLRLVTDKWSCGNSEKVFVPPKAEKVQPLKQKSLEIERRYPTPDIEIIKQEDFHANGRAWETENLNSAASSTFHGAASTDDPILVLPVPLHDNQTASLDNRDGEILGNAILELSEDILLGRRSETYRMENSTNPSKDKRKTGSGQSGMVGGVRSKIQGIADKIITGQEEEKEGCLYETRREAEVRPCNVLIKSENGASVHEEQVVTIEAKLLEANPGNTGLNVSIFDLEPMSNDPSYMNAQLPVDEHFMELLAEDFSRVVIKLANDSLQTEEKYQQSFNHTNEILDKKVKVNLEMLLRSEIIDLNLIKQSLLDLGKELQKVKKPIEAYCKEKFKLKPDLKDTLRDNIELLCTRNSVLYQYLNDILERLKDMVGGKVKTRTKESKLKKLIIEVEEVMKWINKRTFKIQNWVKSSFEERFF